MLSHRLGLLLLMNQRAMVSVKTVCGATERTLIENIIMQGTVWGPLMATVTMDKLAKQVNENQSVSYKYKQEVEVGPLEMIDDILTITKCQDESTVIMNAEVNAFIESKKLKLNETKCGRIHVGRKTMEQCLEVFVHEHEMKNKKEEKYLGDKINTSGKPKETIEERRNKGYAIVSQVMALIKELPIAGLRVKIGLMLRDAFFVNGILFNSECWHSITKEDIRKLEVVDHFLLRSVLGAHAKVPIEHLYLETGSLPIRHVIRSRRLCFLQTLLKRPEEEITRKIFETQKKNPSPGDWTLLVCEDQQQIGLQLSESEIASMPVDKFKEIIKTKVRKAAFEELENMKNSHEKVKENKYKNLKRPQEYMVSSMLTNEEVSLLFALRSRTVREIKENFPYLQQNGTMCPLCGICGDSQEHLLECRMLGAAADHVEYSDMYRGVESQKAFVKEFFRRVEQRKRLIADEAEDAPAVTMPACANQQ